MFKKIIDQGKKILSGPQDSVLSAASIIMLMVVASRVLGLVRQRVLAHYFVADELSLFFAAFRLPDLVFEVLVFGTFSSAFIPVFTRSLKKGNSKAWETAGIIVNIGFLVFISFAAILSLHAEPIYGLLAPGYSGEDRLVIVNLARILLQPRDFLW
jgi:putative peptidoglycan lipid II flippase